MYAARGDIEGSMDDTNEPRAPSEPREVSVEPPSRHTDIDTPQSTCRA